MKIEIDVQSIKEGEQIRRALNDPELRAVAIVVGILLPFTKRTQARILNFVQDHCEELAELEEKGLR